MNRHAMRFGQLHIGQPFKFAHAPGQCHPAVRSWWKKVSHFMYTDRGGTVRYRISSVHSRIQVYECPGCAPLDHPTEAPHA